MAKLHAFGVGHQFLNFLSAYLSPRRGQVVVQGAFSEEFEIANSVFQGTVLGPPLWKTFFADVAQPASSEGGSEAMFADDLNVFQEVEQHTPLAEIQCTLEKCRTKVLKWGKL